MLTGPYQVATKWLMSEPVSCNITFPAINIYFHHHRGRLEDCALRTLGIAVTAVAATSSIPPMEANAQHMGSDCSTWRNDVVDVALVISVDGLLALQ